MDRQFNDASLILVGSVVRVKRRFAAAMCCSARLSCWFRAGTNARAGARGQAGGGRHEPARRRARLRSDGDGGGYLGEALVEKFRAPRCRNLNGGFDRFQRPVWSTLGVGNGLVCDVPIDSVERNPSSYTFVYAEAEV
jgi:hypothetical protein